MGSKGSVLKRSGVETEERYLTWAVLTTPTRMGSAGYNPDVCTYGLKKWATSSRGNFANGDSSAGSMSGKVIYGGIF